MSRSADPLSQNARQRAAALRSAGCVRDLDWARWGVTLDDPDYQALILRYPELDFGNPEIDKELRSKAWAPAASPAISRRWLASRSRYWTSAVGLVA